MLVLATGYLPPTSVALAEDPVSFDGIYDITWDMQYSARNESSVGPVTRYGDPYTGQTHTFQASGSTYYEGRYSGSGVFRVAGNETFTMSTSNVHAYENREGTSQETNSYTPECPGRALTTRTTRHKIETTEPDKYKEPYAFPDWPVVRVFNFQPDLQPDGKYVVTRVIDDPRRAPIHYFVHDESAHCDGFVGVRHQDETVQQSLIDQSLVEHYTDLTSTDKTGTKFVQDTQLVDDTRIGLSPVKYNGHIRVTITRRGVKPTASFTAQPTTADRRVRLDASGSKPAPEGTITQYEWDFGDGTLLATSSPTINHKFPEGDRDYTVKLVVVSEKGARSDPYSLDVHSPKIPPKVEIGTTDGIEPAIDTSRFASTLKVKTVEGLGCSISGTDGPACKVEWLRTPTQQKSDENFVPATDSVPPDHEYDLTNNVSNGNDDTWHKFKVKVTDPETNDTVESNVLEVDTMVGRVEAMMRKNSWLNGAELQRKWKESASAVKPAWAFTDTDTIKMDSFVLTFERAQKEYNKILTRVRTNDQKQQAQIEKLLDRHQLRDGQPHSFGNFETDGMAKLDHDSIQSEGVGEGTFAKAFVPLDDLTASLNAFEFKAAVSGTIQPVPGEKKLRVRIKEAGIFVEDDFDFEGTEPLGCWDPLTDTLSRSFAATCSNGTALDNAAYRMWREHHNKGGDFKVYSDIKREPLNLEFTVAPVKYTK